MKNVAKNKTVDWLRWDSDFSKFGVLHWISFDCFDPNLLVDWRHEEDPPRPSSLPTDGGDDVGFDDYRRRHQRRRLKLRHPPIKFMLSSQPFQHFNSYWSGII